MKTFLLPYAKYNLWANKRIAELLGKTDASLLHEEIKSSFPSIFKTTMHIWGAETIWLNRMNGLSRTTFPSAPLSDNELLKNFISGSESFLSFVESKEETFFSKTCSFADTKGNTRTSLYWQIIMHCMNHSTYHRGQIITTLREAGITSLPATDMIVYFLEVK